jgi:hypothetical protein
VQVRVLFEATPDAVTQDLTLELGENRFRKNGGRGCVGRRVRVVSPQKGGANGWP